jgi:hypothetical protein
MHGGEGVRSMIATAELAGFVAAHVLGCVADDDSFVPVLAFLTRDGQRKLEQVEVLHDHPATVWNGQHQLEENPFGADDGVLAYWSWVVVAGEELEGFNLEMRSYAFPRARATIAVPYTPASSGRFRVHSPRLVAWEQCEDLDPDAALEAFFRGVDSNEQGAMMWAAALDESK